MEILEQEVSFEEIIKGSRFLSELIICETQAQAREIIKAQKNRMAEISKETNSGKKSIIQSIKETIGTAKDSLLIERRSSLKKICKCPKCGAELVGGKGEKVKCDYCDTFVVIK